MGHIITDLKEAFRRGNVYIQLIFINVGVFVITTLIGILLQLFNRSAAGIFELLALPASLPDLHGSHGLSSPTCSCMRDFCTSCSTCYGSIGSGHCFCISSRAST